MKFYSNLRFGMLQIISHCKAPLKRSSTQSQPEMAKLNKNLFCRKKKTDNICAIVVAINHVSWAKISLTDSSLIEWDGYTLPNDFYKVHTELNVLLIANELNQILPSSDLYIMERQKKFNSNLFEIYLTAMMTFLLSFDKNYGVKENLHIQNPSVLNRAFKLLVGSERMSARPIVSNILKWKNQNIIPLEETEYPDCCWDLEIPDEYQSCFLNSTMEKQESLSIALLLGLTYLNSNYLEQQKIQNEAKIKRTS